jgi:uncharacterized protein
MKNYIGTIILSLAIIFFAAIIGRSYNYKFKREETISVTGLANVDFTSNLVVWNGSFSKKSGELKSAFSLVKSDEKSIRDYLSSMGVKESEMVFSSVRIEKNYHYTYDSNGSQTGSVFEGYTLTQNVTVESPNIEMVEKISREVTSLIEKGVEFYSNAPSYFYTKLADIKLDLLAKASADAKRRAEIIAENSGANLGNVKRATMGVFQIVGQNSNEDFSYGGAFNTSARNKTGTITMRVEYVID